MELDKVFKKLKKIEADPEYKRLSLAKIVGADKELNPFIWRVVKGIFETGTATVLAVVLILLILGGFSTNFLINKPALDLKGLRAEADAVDIQIKFNQLGEMNLLDPSKITEIFKYIQEKNNEEDQQIKNQQFKDNVIQSKIEKENFSESTNKSEPSSNEKIELTIEEALDFLSK